MAQHDLTAGPVPRQLRALWLPTLAAMALQSVYAFVDLVFVAMLGDRAVAALGITLQAFFIILALGQMVGTTALSDVSQAYGRGDVTRARALFTTHTIFALVLGIVASIGAWLLADDYVAAFSDDPEVRALGAEYFRASAPTFLLQVLIIVFSGCERASGDFTGPMRIMAVSVALNAVLDPLLMFGLGPIPALGIAGAGHATVLAQLVTITTYALRFTRRQRSDPRALGWRRPTRQPGALRRVLRQGFPAGLQFFAVYLVTGVVLAGVRPFGADWTGAASGGFRLIQQVWMPLVTLGMAAGSMTGQNVGAMRPDRVSEVARTAIRWGLVYGALGGVAVAVAAPWLAHIASEGPGQHALITDYLIISAPMLLSFPLAYIPVFMLQAAGHTLAPMLAAGLRVGVLAALVLLLLPALGMRPGGLSPAWVFGASAAASFFEGGLCVWLLGRFLRGLKQHPTLPAA